MLIPGNGGLPSPRWLEGHDPHPYVLVVVYMHLCSRNPHDAVEVRMEND